MRGLIIPLGTLPILGAQLGTFFPIQRLGDETGIIQIQVSSIADVTDGDFRLMISADPANGALANELTAINFDMTTLPSHGGALFFDVPLGPQMRMRVAAGASAPQATVTAFLMV